MKLASLSLAILILVSSPAHAQVEWATWGSPGGSNVTGTFNGGATVTLTSFFDDISGGIAAGAGWNSASPLLPGRPDGTNPPYMQMVTGSPHPVVIANGAQVLSLDLTGITIDTLTTVGFSDFKSGNWYYLKLLDGSDTPLSLLTLRLTHYDMVLAGSGWAVDYDLSINLNDGFMLAVGPHQVPGAFYDHSGVVLLDHLPPLTRRVVVTSGRAQDSEGISIYVGRADTTPVKPTTWSGIKRLAG